MKIFTGMLGLCVGSYVQCLIDRYPNYFISKFSVCDKCKTKLKIIDLIPIFSFIFLKGKCRYCKNKISSNTIITEFIFLVSFVWFYIYKSDNFIVLCTLFSCLYLACFTDIKHMEIPDICFILILIVSVFYNKNDYVFGFCVLFVCSILSYFNQLGFGDTKLLFSLSFYFDAYSFIASLLIACLLAMIYILIRKRFEKGTLIKFAPFISISYFITYVLLN